MAIDTVRNCGRRSLRSLTPVVAGARGSLSPARGQTDNAAKHGLFQSRVLVSAVMRTETLIIVETPLPHAAKRLHIDVAARMRFTVRPKHNHGNGSFSVSAAGAREALEAAKRLVERGVKDVEILDEDRQPYDLAELERRTRDAEEL